MAIEAGSIGAAVLGGVSALLALLLALALVRLGAALFALLAPRDAEAVPLLHVMGLVGGVALGIALLAAMPESAIFRPGRVFAADGPWMLDLRGFLSRAVLPGRATVEALGAELIGGSWLGCLLAWAAALGLGGGIAVAALGWRGVTRLRALLAVLMLAGWTALLIHYGAHLLAWVSAQLNFWIFALLLLGFQRWRYGPRGAH
jgi:hypothetical protein